MNQRHRLLLFATLLVAIAVIAAVFGTRFIRDWRENAIDAKASHVYGAIRAAGNWKRIRPLPEEVASIPSGVVSVVMFEGGELEGGIAIRLVNNDATFWLKDDVFYTVNDEAKALLPDAPQAPAPITDAAIRAVAD